MKSNSSIQSTRSEMPEIRETSSAVAPSLARLSPAARKVSNSTSRLAKRIAADFDFWISWLRQPSVDVAESVIRLRRLRGLSQAELADRMGTKQPAIARIEAGRANVGSETLVRLAEALDATVRIEIAPCEMMNELAPQWWDRVAQAMPFGGSNPTVLVKNHQTINNFQITIGHPRAAQWMEMEPAQAQSFDVRDAFGSPPARISVRHLSEVG
jgi:transcriptional regulator with XRE-family HTH domain